MGVSALVYASIRLTDLCMLRIEQLAKMKKKEAEVVKSTKHGVNKAMDTLSNGIAHKQPDEEKRPEHEHGQSTPSQPDGHAADHADDT